MGDRIACLVAELEATDYLDVKYHMLAKDDNEYGWLARRLVDRFGRERASIVDALERIYNDTKTDAGVPHEADKA